MKEIKITDIENIKIGNAENKEAATGCTVIICERGAVIGLDVRGGGPASRESELTKAQASTDVVHAVLLSGGSAFGLDASGGVMKYLEERNIGFDVGITKVPLVCQSCIFDLRIGDYKVRPDINMGYEACVNAQYLKKANHLSNLKNINGDCVNLINNYISLVDTIIVDPPKAGMNKNVVECINISKSKRIIYVSCEVATLVRDVKYLSNYHIIEISLFDMFARTGEYEVVAILDLNK